LVVDVSWDESIKFDEGYDDILVRVFTEEVTKIKKIAAASGEEILGKAMMFNCRKSEHHELR